MGLTSKDKYLSMKNNHNRLVFYVALLGVVAGVMNGVVFPSAHHITGHQIVEKSHEELKTHNDVEHHMNDVYADPRQVRNKTIDSS